MEFLDDLNDTTKDSNSIFTFNEIGGDDSKKDDLPFGFGSKSSVNSNLPFTKKDSKVDFSVGNLILDTQNNNPLNNFDFLNTISEVPESNNNIFSNNQDFGNVENNKPDIDFLNSEMVNNKNSSQSNFAFSQFQENGKEEKLNFNINNFMNSSKRSNCINEKEGKDIKKNEINDANMNKKNEISNNNKNNVINVKINNASTKNTPVFKNNNNKNGEDSSNTSPVINNTNENAININANNNKNNLDSISLTQLIQSSSLSTFDNGNNINNNQDNISNNLMNLMSSNNIDFNSANSINTLNTIKTTDNNIQKNKNQANNNIVINENNNKNNQTKTEKLNNTNLNQTSNNISNNANNTNSNINIDLLKMSLSNLQKLSANKDKLNLFSNELSSLFNQQQSSNNNIIPSSFPKDIKRKEPDENNKKDSDLKDFDSLLNFAKENPINKAKNITNNINVFNNPLLMNQNINNNLNKKQNKILENLPPDSFDKKNEILNLNKKEIENFQQMETSSKNKQNKINKENINNNDEQNGEIPNSLEVIKKYNELVLRLNKLREKAKILRGLTPYFTKLISTNENFNIEFPILLYRMLETYNVQTNRLLSLMKMKNYKMNELNEEFDEEIKKYSLAFPDNL